MTEERPAPAGVNPSRPSVARMYDYYLAGKDNFAADRAAADAMMAIAPRSVRAVRENRAFLTRAVRFLAGEAGIRQFIDIGSGLPTRSNVHEVAQEAAPGARVVYVDFDPMAVVHGQALLATDVNTAFIAGDLRAPSAILGDPDLRALIDLDRPVALLLIAVLHFVHDDEDPGAVLKTLTQAMAPGSWLAVSHVMDHPDTQAIGEIMATSGARAWRPRSHRDVMGFFDGFDVVPPGVVTAPRWRPEGRPAALKSVGPADVEEEELTWQLVGLARKR